MVLVLGVELVVRMLRVVGELVVLVVRMAGMVLYDVVLGHLLLRLLRGSLHHLLGRYPLLLAHLLHLCLMLMLEMRLHLWLMLVLMLLRRLLLRGSLHLRRQLRRYGIPGRALAVARPHHIGRHHQMGRRSGDGRGMLSSEERMRRR